MSGELSSDAASICTRQDTAVSGISKKTLDRFAALKERRERQTHRSTARRIRDIKSALASRIETEFSNADEIAALQSNNVEISSFCAKEKQQTKTAGIADKPASSCSGTLAECSSTGETSWLEIKPYLGINSHLNDDTGGSAAPKTGLELSISRAIALQEYDVAEDLSDQLATRDFGVKVAEAIDAKRFRAKREHDAAVKKAAKKRKLAWTFEPKHRWETKGNM